MGDPKAAVEKGSASGSEPWGSSSWRSLISDSDYVVHPRHVTEERYQRNCATVKLCEKNLNLGLVGKEEMKGKGQTWKERDNISFLLECSVRRYIHDCSTTILAQGNIGGCHAPQLGASPGQIHVFYCKNVKSFSNSPDIALLQSQADPSKTMFVREHLVDELGKGDMLIKREDVGMSGRLTVSLDGD